MQNMSLIIHHSPARTPWDIVIFTVGYLHLTKCTTVKVPHYLLFSNVFFFDLANKTSTSCLPTPPATKPTQVTVPTARTGATNLPTTRMIHPTTKTSGTLNTISTKTTRKRPLCKYFITNYLSIYWSSTVIADPL